MYDNGMVIESISPYTVATRYLCQVRMYVEVGKGNARRHNGNDSTLMKRKSGKRNLMFVPYLNVLSLPST